MPPFNLYLTGVHRIRFARAFTSITSITKRRMIGSGLAAMVRTISVSSLKDLADFSLTHF